MAIAKTHHVTERSSDTQFLNLAARVVAMVAAAALTIVGLIAVAKVNWSDDGFDAPAETVADIAFAPGVAIATLLLGVLALGAAVSWDRESKLFMGALLVAIGIAIVAANPTVQDVVMTDRMGWLAIIVGGVLAAAGVIAGQSWSSRRAVRDETSTI